MGRYDIVDVSDLIGKTFQVESDNDSYIKFTLSDGSYYMMEHHQDCCESVSIEDITGDLSDLSGVPILHASEDTNSADAENLYDSATWTFYNFRTIKGSVTVRWYGTSNGYYSETAGVYYYP